LAAFFIIIESLLLLVLEKDSIIEKKEFKNHSGSIKLVKFIISNSNSTIIASDVFKALRNKDVRVNNVKVKEDIIIKNDDLVEIFLPDTLNVIHKKNELFYNIIYEDENVLIVDKKQGFAVHAEKNNDSTNLIDEVRKNISSAKNSSLCHRIDRNTGGLVIIAKNENALKELLRAIKEKKIIKNYYAIVSGKPIDITGTLINFLSKNDKIGQVFVHEKKEKGDLTAITHYKVLQSEKNISLLELELETGRMHQIRAQVANAGFPIIGDGKYGNTVINRKYKVKMQLLFAFRIKFQLDKSSFLFYLNKTVFEIDCGVESLFKKLTQ